jgi:hypothetical protein
MIVNDLKVFYLYVNQGIFNLQFEPLDIVFLTLLAVFAIKIVLSLFGSISELNFSKIKTKLFRMAQVIPLV